MSTKNLFESSKSFKGNGMIDGPPPPEGEEEENALSLYGRYETLRLKTKKFVSTHIIGIYYNELLIYLSIFSTLQYVYSTYSSVNKSSFQKSLDSLEMVLAALFAFDWMLSFFMADHKLDFLFSFFSMVDLLTVVPIWITINSEPVKYSEIHTFNDTLLYILFFLNTTRVLRSLRIYKKLNTITDEVQRSLGEMVLTVVVLILFNAAVMQYLEADVQPLNFHTWLYFCWIETATVGYGDINALSDLARVAVMIFIGLALILLPKMTNQLLDKMGQYSFYQRVVYKPKARSKHVLVCGDMGSTSVIEFFEELFHEDHDVENMMAIILQPTPPSSEMRTILNHPDLSLCTVYVEGTALSTSDLERCCADTAVGIFVLTNKFSANPDEEDTKTILRLFSIRRYCQNNNPFMNSFICLQLIRPENQRHLETQAGGNSNFSDENDDSNIIVCINRVKMGVIAKSANYPGTSTLIMNLLTSFADDEEEEDVGNDDEDDDAGNWLDEYNRGCDWEVYVTDLSDTFCGEMFSQLSMKLYLLYGVLLFALHVRDKSGKAATRILINPLDYRIPSFDDFAVQGIVMAKNKNASNLTFSGDGIDSQSKDPNQFVLHQLQLSSLGGHNGEPDSIYRDSGSRREVGSSDRLIDGSSLRVSGEYGKTEKPTLSWQALMRKHHVDKNANESQQEKLQNLEDAHLRENFYIREKRVPISQVTISTSVSDEIPHLSNHIIILGKGLSNMYDLIRPLRAKSLGLLRYIVVVNPTEIPHAIWQRIAIFEGIFFVRGSALEENDLRRAGIFRASKVIVLAAAVSNPQEIREMGALVDADAIFSYQAVKRLNERAHCVIEIVRQSSIAYLNNDDSVGAGETKEDTYRFTPQFAGGVLYISSMLDTLSVQTFYNPLIIKVLEKLIGSQKYDDADISSLDGGGGRKVRGLAAVKSSALYQIAIPDGLDSRTYGALFRKLAPTGVIPIGLFRGVFPQMKVGSKNNKMSYVYTNPTKDTELFSCDRVFVLSPNPLIKLTSKDSKDFQLVENHLKQREVSTAEASANALREDFYHLINGQQDMQDHLHKMKNSIFEQLETTLNAVNGLNNTMTAAEENRSITRNRLGSASGSSKMRGQSASPVGRLRKTSSLFSVETKNDIATARNRYLSNKERSSKKVDDTFPTSTPLRPSFSSPVVGNRKRLVTT